MDRRLYESKRHTMYFLIMRIIWDESKNEWLQENRGISFSKIRTIINKGDVLDIVESISRNHPFQKAFILRIFNHIWVVPFELFDDTLKLVTAYPSRKLKLKYKKRRWFRKNWSEAL